MVKKHSSLVPLVLTVAAVAMAAQQATPQAAPVATPQLFAPRLRPRFGERPPPHPMVGTLQGFLG